MGFNPLKRARQLVSSTPASEQDTRPIHWRRSRRSKAKRAVADRLPLVFAAIALSFTLVLWLYPVIPSAQNNGAVLAAGLIISTNAVTWHIRGRSLLEELSREIDLHVDLQGTAVRVRAGVDHGNIDQHVRAFTPMRKLAVGWRGLYARYERFRDRYSKKEVADRSDKFHRAGKDGTGQVKDGLLRAMTFEADSIEGDVPLVNKIIVTHSGEWQGLDDDEPYKSSKVDAMASLPPVLDKRTSRVVRHAFDQQVTAASEAEDLVRTLEDYIAELEKLVDPQGQPVFDQTTQMLSRFGFDKRRMTSDGDSSEPGTDERANGNGAVSEVDVEALEQATQ